MNKNAIIAVVVVAAIALAVVITKKKKSDSPTARKNIEQPQTIEERLDMDRGNLQDYLDSGTGDKHDLYGAMVRLTEFKDPLGEKVALQLAESDERLHREGAAQSLGNFDTPAATQALIKLASDREPTVRKFALRGFGKVQSNGRLKVIKDLLDENTISRDEKPFLYTSYHLATEDSKEKNWAIEKLIDMAQSGEQEVSDKAMLQILQIAPRHSKTKNMLYDKIEGSSDPRVIGSGIRILSQQRDPWILKKLPALAEHKNPMVRKAVIQSLHKHCSPNRWTLLSNMMNTEQNKSVIETAIREATLLSGDGAIKFFELISSMKLHARAQQLLENGKTKVATAKGPCR